MITIQKKLIIVLALISLLAAWILTTPSNAEDAEVIEAEAMEEVAPAKTMEKTPAKPKVESAKDETKTSISEARLADKAAKVLELQKSEVSTKRIPQNVRNAARCIVVFPSIIKAGLIVAGKTGQGLVSCRHITSNNWGAPSYVSLNAASIGLQAGIQKASVILVLLNRDAVDELIDPEVKLGAGVEITAGPVGGSANLENVPSVLSYARTKGLFAGLDLEGAKIGVSKEQNMQVYGEKITTKEILFTKDKIPTRFDSFMSALGELAPIPAN